MDWGAFDIIIGVASIVVGILLLAGKGDFLMSGKNADQRKNDFDEAKVKKDFGVVFLLVGIGTFVNRQFDTQLSNMIYLVFLLLAFGGGIFYMQKFCKK